MIPSSATIFRFLQQKQWASAGEIFDWQFEQLRRLLDHTIRYVPWYRRRYEGLNVEEIRCHSDLQSLPILTRTEVQQHHQDFLAESLPEGVHASGPSYTSGSTGIPLSIFATNYRQNWWTALCLRDLIWCGIDPRKTLLGLRKVPHGSEEDARFLAGAQANHWGKELNSLTETGPAYLMNVQQKPADQLAYLQRINPDYLVSYPSNLVQLARRLRQRPPALKVIHAISEEVTAEDRNEIQAAFDCPVKNVYTCEEAGYLASPCPDSDAFHVHDENVIVEVLDQSNQPCGHGTTGRIVLTSLHNHYMPLIRYDIGDYAEVLNACSCGRGLTRLGHVFGKQRPVLHLPNGEKKSSHVLAGLIRDVGNFCQFQLRQSKVDEIHLKLVPDINWTAEKSEHMVATVQHFFQHPMQVDIQICDHIAPDHSGKRQSFLCDL